MRIQYLFTVLVVVVGWLAFPTNASAALDVRSDGAGGLRVQTTTDSAEVVTIDRTTAGLLRILEASTTTTSSDGACAPDAEQPTAVACSIASGAKVAVVLGSRADRLDARAARGVALVVNGGAASDRLRLGSSGTTRVTDATPNDVIDLSHANGAMRVRYGRSVGRVVASCGGCAPRWSVRLPAAPGRVLLGSRADDVDLVAWRTRGRTSWGLGGGNDRFGGSPVHRAIVDGAGGDDVLISRAASDVLRGGAGNDKLVDLGGLRDVLLGGPGMDLMSALDGRPDTMDGQGDRDSCLSLDRYSRGCGEGGVVRNLELSVYFPIVTTAGVFATLGL